MRQIWEFEHDGEGPNVKINLMINAIKIHMVATQLYDQMRVKCDQAKQFTEREVKCSQVGEITFIKFANYCLFCPTCFSGPALEYTLFDDFVNVRGQYKRMPIGGNVLPFLRRLAESLTLLAINISFEMKFRHDYLVSPELGE